MKLRPNQPLRRRRLLQLRNDRNRRVPRFGLPLPEVGNIQRPPKPAWDMLFRLAFQGAQVRRPFRLLQARTRSGDNPVQDSGHKESFDYKGRRGQSSYQVGAPFFARLLRKRWEPSTLTYKCPPTPYTVFSPPEDT